jgi:hypothetical protein
MNLYLTLDYELFLMIPPDNIEHSLIDPTNKFNNILKKYNVNATYYVDAGYLFALNKQKKDFPKLNDDFNKVVSQLQNLELSGNDIGLHVHPHWEDCYYNGCKWIMNHSRYKLADFTKEEATSILVKYYILLQSILKYKIQSYRAGGWCIEPFSNIRDALIDCEIFIDSSVFIGGFCNNKTHQYDFRKYPKKETWKFNSDPYLEDPNGLFTELPFTSYQLSPILYWKILFNKLISKFSNTLYNNKSGHAINPSFEDVLKKLFFKSFHAVSIDSFKSSYLKSIYLKQKINNTSNFNIIGHPKCFSEKTYLHVDSLIQTAINSGDSFQTVSSINK